MNIRRSFNCRCPVSSYHAWRTGVVSLNITMSAIVMCVFVVVLCPHAYESFGFIPLPNIPVVIPGVSSLEKVAEAAGAVAGEAGKVAGEVTVVAGQVAEETAESTKIVGSPLERAALGTLSKACASVKYLFGIDFDEYKKGIEPNVEDLTLSLKTSKGLTVHSISNAYRTIPSLIDFDRTKKIVLYFHGFTDDPTGSSFGTINKAFLEKTDYNILGLDASSLIKWLYVRSSTYVRFIGEKVGNVLAEMVKVGVPRENILLVGHSLGSHIAGFTAKIFRNITGQSLVRISSLDPAGPCFINLEDNFRLSKKDADFVDVIHSNGGVFGLKEAIGHVDFYPNGGSTQPGCVLPTCEHSRAWQLYADSVENPKSFPARKCTDWTAFINNKCENSTSFMGFVADPKVSGVFYLQTNANYPFGRGKDGLEASSGFLAYAKESTLQTSYKVVDAVV